MTEPNQFTEYKGLFYRYEPLRDWWEVSSTPDRNGWLWVFPATKTRIDQAFDHVNNDQDYQYYLKTKHLPKSQWSPIITPQL